MPGSPRGTRPVRSRGSRKDLRYAVPREALLYALVRQSQGCSQITVGRDHAGVGSYYGPFEAHEIFGRIPPDTVQTQALKSDIAFWCSKCGGMLEFPRAHYTELQARPVAAT